ncbi:hypothetical protein TYRP_006386 [Tyrophagus putrescentiae]|nr:hypothetical protein TYRP_006386 [Tyrophagus putrescentiae]
MVRHQRPNLLLLLLLFGISRKRRLERAVESQPVPFQLEPRSSRGQQAEVQEEEEQFVASLRQLSIAAAVGLPGAGGQLRIEVRKEDVVSVDLGIVSHTQGETDKRAFNGGHRLRDVVIGGHCGVRNGFLVLLFLLRRVAAIDAVNGPNDGDEAPIKPRGRHPHLQAGVSAH